MTYRRLFLLLFSIGSDKKEPIGIYGDSLNLKEAYDRVLRDDEGKYQQYLEKPDAKLLIFEFDEEKQEFIDVDPEDLFRRVDGVQKRYKMVRFVIDNACQYSYFRSSVCTMTNGMHFCTHFSHLKELQESGMETDLFRDDNTEIELFYEAEGASKLLQDMDCWWGGWNECPSAKLMAEKVRKWEERYGAELQLIAHDFLSFRCREKPGEKEAELLLKELNDMGSNALDLGDYSELKDKLIEEGIFEIWWD